MDLQPLRIDRSSAGPRRPAGRGAPRWALLAGLVAVVGVGLWLLRAPLAAGLDRLQSVQVRVARAERLGPAAAGAVRGMAANGYIVAARRAALSADTPGRIVELNVTEGSVVKEGDVVARLFADEYAAALRRSEADLLAAQAARVRAAAAVESAKAEVARLESARAAATAQVGADAAELALARQSFERQRVLAAQGITTPQALDEAQAALERGQARLRASQAQEHAAAAAITEGRSRVGVAEADLEVACAQTAVAGAARDLAAATLAKTEVRAPFDGVVVLKDAEVGEVVSPNVQGGTSARGSVATMVDFASLEVQCDVPESSLGGVVVGAPARVFLDAYPGQGYEARVDRVWPTANRQKATVEVRVKLLAPDLRLRPEMGVRVVFLADPAEASAPAEASPPAAGVVLVPEGALAERGGRTGVFVVDRGQVTFREVAADGGPPPQPGRVAISAGLAGGERVVVDPPASLGGGDRVRVVEG